MDGEVLGEAMSLCPSCMRQIPGRYVRHGSQVLMEKSCPDCGESSAVVWNGFEDFSQWYLDLGESAADCDLFGCCEQEAAFALVEVTSKCDSACSVCYAHDDSCQVAPGNVSFSKICRQIDAIADIGNPILQISGGEPTVRDDLPDIIEHAKSNGLDAIQLNTNGKRIASDLDYLLELRDAGLTFVFMGFDGLDDGIYLRLRNERLLEAKLAAIENCAEAEVGVVLVPTIVRGVNDSQIGSIIRFALEKSPVVRGVHFQPAALMGRTGFAELASPVDHFTLDELMEAIYSQAPDLVRRGDLAPSHCDHPMCGFHASYIKAPDGTLAGPLKREDSGASTVVSARANRDFISKRWTYTRPKPGSDKLDISTMGGFLERVKTHSFTISAMAFLDATNMDSNRIRRCSLHVIADDRGLIPFCLRYATPLR